MAIKATLRKPVESAPLGKPAPYIDVEATVTTGGVDETSAEQLARDLEAGAPIPGSDEAILAETTAVATRPHAPVSRMFDQDGEGGLQGDFDSSDFKIPQLKIVNGSGELSERFNQGTLIFSDELLWSPPNPQEDAKNPTLRFVPLQIVKQFRENLTQDQQAEGLMPRIVDTVAEVRELGGGVRWINGQKPSWSPSAKCILLVEKPEGAEHEGFGEELDGKVWAKAVLYAAGTTYGAFVKPILDAANVALRENKKVVLHAKVWTFQVVKKKAGTYMVFVPSVKLVKPHSVTGPEVREVAAQLNGVAHVPVVSE